MSKSCKKPVYKTMCESPSGERTGKYGQITYVSKYKKGEGPKKPSPAKRPASKSPTRPKDSDFRAKISKAKSKTKASKTRYDEDSRIDDLEQSYMSMHQQMYRDEQLRRAYAERRTKNRKRR